MCSDVGALRGGRPSVNGRPGLQGGRRDARCGPSSDEVRVNLKTAARRLGVHYQTAYRWVRSGQLVAGKVGAGYEISAAALERFEAQRVELERLPDPSSATLTIAGSEPETREHALEI